MEDTAKEQVRQQEVAKTPDDAADASGDAAFPIVTIEYDEIPIQDEIVRAPGEALMEVASPPPPRDGPALPVRTLARRPSQTDIDCISNAPSDIVDGDVDSTEDDDRIGDDVEFEDPLFDALPTTDPSRKLVAIF